MVKELIQGLGGFDGKASSVSAVDLLGLLGKENATSTVQALIDVIADKVLNQLLLRSNVVNNALTTEEGYALDARMGKSLQDQITAQNSNLDSGYFKIKVKTTTIVLIIEEFTFTNGVATKTLQSIFGNIPTYASGICQTKVEDSSVYNFTAVKDGNNLKIATAGSTFSGKKWVTMIIFGTA